MAFFILLVLVDMEGSNGQGDLSSNTSIKPMTSACSYPDFGEEGKENRAENKYQ